MKIRKRRVILGAVVLAVLSAGGWHWYHTSTDEYKARQLVAELRELYIGTNPDSIKRWLIKLGLMNERKSRSDEEILDDLVALGEKSVPALIEALKDNNHKVREIVISVLGTIGKDSDAIKIIPALIQTLKSEDAYDRQNAACALGQIGPSARQAVPALIRSLKDTDNKVRISAFWALHYIEPAVASKEVVGPLIEAMGDNNESVQIDAAKALGAIGPAAEEAVPSLIKTLKNKTEGEASHPLFGLSLLIEAARALGEIGPAAKESVPALIKLLESELGDEDNDAWISAEDARCCAAEALGKIGPEAKEAVPALVEALKDEDEYVRKAAAEAMEKIEAKTKAE